MNGAPYLTPAASVESPSRPRFATLIRVRQEVSKRIDSVRGAATAVDAAELARMLTPEARLSARSGLYQAFASQADVRYPRRHLRGRDPSTLPDGPTLVSLANDAARGNWSVFHTPVVAGHVNGWRAHPITGADTANDHWRRIDYMRGIDGADVKFIWELNRHHALVRIAQGYFVSRDPALAKRVVELLDDWVVANPPGRGINWTSSLEIGFRSIAWCWVWLLTADSSAWTDERLARFLVSLWHHANHIDRYDSTHHSPNTHLTGELLALYYIGLTFPEFRRSKRWTQRGRDVLLSELDRQVLKDGMHFERSVGYHRYTAEFYLHFALLARAAGSALPGPVIERIRGLVAASRLLRLPDGTWPVIGDEDSGSTLLLGTGDPQSHTTILATGAALFGGGAWLDAVDVSGRSGAWWLLDDELLVSLGRTPPQRSATRSGALRHAGYYVGRDSESRDAWHCIVDAGPHGGDRTGHAHTDLGHVEISHGAIRVVRDPGCSSYTTNPSQRDWARSEAAHACLVVDAAPLATPRGPFAWDRLPEAPTVRSADEGDAQWWCELTYRRPSGTSSLEHVRQVVLIRKCGVIVADWVDADAPAAFALHWPLATSSVELDATRVSAPDFAIQWRVVVGESGQASLQAIRSSPGYAREQDATLIRVPARTDRRAVIVTSFTAPDVTLAIARESHGIVQCELHAPGQRWTVEVRRNLPPVVAAAEDSRG